MQAGRNASDWLELGRVCVVVVVAVVGEQKRKIILSDTLSFFSCCLAAVFSFLSLHWPEFLAKYQTTVMRSAACPGEMLTKTLAVGSEHRVLFNRGKACLAGSSLRIKYRCAPQCSHPDLPGCLGLEGDCREQPGWIAILFTADSLTNHVIPEQHFNPSSFL